MLNTKRILQCALAISVSCIAFSSFANITHYSKDAVILNKTPKATLANILESKLESPALIHYLNNSLLAKYSSLFSA